jgi:transposase
MTELTQPLPDDIALLKEIILQQRIEIQHLREQFMLARHRQFARSSEKSPDQTEFIFNEAESLADINTDKSENTTEEEVKEDAENKPAENELTTPPKPGRKPLPLHLPRETRLIDIPDAQKICPCCQGALHRMGEEISEQLEYIPAVIKIIETVRPKYACRHCEKTAVKTPVIIAPAPASPIPKSIATPSLLAQIMCNKYQFALPLYRQEALFQQYAIDLNRRSMANWMIQCADWFEHIVDALKIQLLQQKVLHIDETPVKVIQEEGQKNYMWVYCSGGDSPDDHRGLNNIVLYDYQPSREAIHPKQYLNNYAGFVQVDGYAAYEQTRGILVGCMAHARRKFVDAQKIQPKGKVGKADWAINHLQKLYIIEKHIKHKTITERYAVRQAQALPLLQQFKTWLDKSQAEVPPKSAVGKAIFYCLNQWPKLIAYTQDGILQIDNNRAERAVKPFVIGRKNWLFSATTAGARASATIYSVVETAKANGLEPLRYIQLLLETLPSRAQDDSLEDLMPWAVKG